MPKERKLKCTPALCLAGGGFRGFAHIGVLRAFEEENIDFPIVTGTSVGSLVGGVYAAGASYKEILQMCREVKVKDIHNGILLTPQDPGKIGQFFNRYLGNLKFSNLKRKFACVASDLIENREVVLTEGELSQAISASCCVPVLFKPIPVNGCHLVDGGVHNNIPADVARVLGADAVISVDINSTRGAGTESTKLGDILATIFRSYMSFSSTAGLINSDIIIAPDLVKFSPFSKDGWEEMIELGYEATVEQMDKIKELLFK